MTTTEITGERSIVRKKFVFASRTLLLLGASTMFASTALAQATREEIQRDRLEQQLRTEGQPVAVDGEIERAPCPLADPQFADLRFTFRDAQFSGLEAIDPSLVAPAYAGLAGQELSVSAVCDIRDRAATILRQAGYLAAVQVPVQRIEDGTVRFDVVLARLATVQVRGEPGKSGALLQRYIDKLVGQPVFNTNDAERYLLLARDIPGLDVRLTLQPASRESGAQPGDVVGVFNVERTIFTADLNVQNFGSKAIGRFGALGRMTFNGLTGLGDETTIGFYTTADTSEQQVLQLGHQFRVGGEGLTLGGDFTYAWTTPGIPGPDVFDSETLVASGFATYPFVRSQSSNLFGTLGLDFIDQDVDFTGLPLSRDRLRVAYARLDFNLIDSDSVLGRGGYTALEPRFGLAGTIEVRQGLDIFGASEGCGPAFALCALPGVIPISRLDADPTALVLRAEGQVDYRPTPLLKFTLRPRVQYSPDALLSYEQVSGGNYTAGRGYDPGAVVGDSGYGGQFEVAYGSLIPNTPDSIALQPYAFFDVMAVHRKNTPGDPQTISSAGGGLRATFGQRFSLDVLGAIPLERSPFQTQRGDVRFLINLTVLLAPWKR